jgi:hypothetical protein
MSAASLAVYTVLGGAASVTTLVGTRIYGGTAPQNAALPLIVHRVTAVERDRSGHGPSGHSAASVLVECYATTYEGAQALAAAVRVALDGYSGLAAGVQVFYMENTNEIDAVESETLPRAHFVPSEWQVTLKG